MRCIRPNNHSAALSVLFGGTIVLSSSTTDSWHRLSWKLEFLGGARDPLPRLSLLSPSQHLISLSSLSHSVLS